MFLQTPARIASALILPFIVTGCDPLSDDGRIANFANQSLAGCDSLAVGSCNQEVFSGVVAKFVEDADTGELSIRFVTVTDNGDGTFTYDDGETEVVLEETAPNTYAGTTTAALFTATDAGLLAAGFGEGTTDGDDMIIGVGGYHTDADVIPTEGLALYEGDANFHLVVSDLEAAGRSELSVNFGNSTADLYAYVESGAIDSFTRLESLNMTIDGYTFTSNDIALYDGGTEVDFEDVTGADSDGAAAGMFFGPIDTNGNPIEFGAVAILSGDDDKLIMYTAGDITSPSP
jgi:hypothetical protein